MSNLKSSLHRALKDNEAAPLGPKKTSNMDNISPPPILRKPLIVRQEVESVSIESPFYNLLKGAQKYDLEFSVDENFEGPHWNEEGTPITTLTCSSELVSVLAVPLSNGLYRLAENPVFEPLTTLNWGDEFQAIEVSSGYLKLTKVVMPMRFLHEHKLISEPLTQGSKLSNKIHELEGGWEIVAGGILTVTLPVENWEKLNDK